jgi:UDP-N-acetylmuramate: L-alanyl-gamma-D-glutamyl-meso-diaminopimelate ligase
MLRQIPKTGRLIVCADLPRASALREHAFCPVESYGFREDADWRIVMGASKDGLQHFTLRHGGEVWGEFRSPLFGVHNMQNAAAAIAAAAAQGASPDTLENALASFKGIKRRMEVFHEAQGVTFVDDFAHHPTAIRETIAAARARWPKRRLIVVFEPRSNTTVTNRFQAEMTEAFSVANEIWLGPIHRAEKIPEADRLDRAELMKDLHARGLQGGYADDVETIVEHVRKSAKAGDVVLVLSNGAFGGIYETLQRTFT